MTQIDSIFENDIVAKLNLITVDNGFSDTVCVLDGSMKFYVDDLTNADKPLYFFPCVSARLGNDQVKPRGDSSGAIIKREIIIAGAVDAIDRQSINRKLNSLALDVRKALAVNNFDFNGSQASSIEIGGAEYEDPIPQDRYAMFEMRITVTYTEKWV